MILCLFSTSNGWDAPLSVTSASPLPPTCPSPISSGSGSRLRCNCFFPRWRWPLSLRFSSALSQESGKAVSPIRFDDALLLWYRYACLPLRRLCTVHLRRLAAYSAYLRHANTGLPARPLRRLYRSPPAPDLANAGAFHPLHCRLEPLYALQHDRGGEAGLHAHGACERRWPRAFAAAPRSTQRRHSPDYRRGSRFWRDRWRRNHHRRYLCLAGHGPPLLPVAGSA